MSEIGKAKCVLCEREVNKVRDTFLEIYVHHKGDLRKHHSVCYECIQRCGDLVGVVFVDIV